MHDKTGGSRVNSALDLESKLHRPQINQRAMVSIAVATLMTCTCAACGAVVCLQRIGYLEQEASGFFRGFLYIFPASLILSAVVLSRSISVFAIRLYQRY